MNENLVPSYTAGLTLRVSPKSTVYEAGHNYERCCVRSFAMIIYVNFMGIFVAIQCKGGIEETSHDIGRNRTGASRNLSWNF